MPEKKPFIFPKKPRGCCFGGGGGSTVAGIGVGVRGDARAMASLFRRGVGGGLRAPAPEKRGAAPFTPNPPTFEIGKRTPFVGLIAQSTWGRCALGNGVEAGVGGGKGV